MRNEQFPEPIATIVRKRMAIHCDVVVHFTYFTPYQRQSANRFWPLLKLNSVSRTGGEQKASFSALHAPVRTYNICIYYNMYMLYLW